MKGDITGLIHSNRACKGCPMPITTLTKPRPFPLGEPLLILPSLHPLLGPLHLSTIPSWPANHFSHMFHPSLSGMNYPRGGCPHTIMLKFYCLHHLLNHKFYTLVHLNNPKCLPSQIQTWTTDNYTNIWWRDILPYLCCWYSGNQPEIWESTLGQPNCTSM